MDSSAEASRSLSVIVVSDHTVAKVVEISSMMIGTDDNGDETPLATVWSLTTMTDKEREPKFRKT